MQVSNGKSCDKAKLARNNLLNEFGQQVEFYYENLMTWEQPLARQSLAKQQEHAIWQKATQACYLDDLV